MNVTGGGPMGDNTEWPELDELFETNVARPAAGDSRLSSIFT